MTQSTLKHLNRLLQDHLGTSPAGGSLYRWFHSRDPEMFTVIGRLMASDTGGTRTEYERVPQVWTHRWVMGMWQPPGDERLWEMRFRGELAYPRRGYYFAVSIPSDPLLEQGVEPNERITMYTIQLRKKQIEMERAGTLYDSFQEDRNWRKREYERELDAAVGDMYTNLEPKLPGAGPEHFA